MSLIDSDSTPDLFFPENFHSSLNPSTLSDDLSDLFSEMTQTPPKKDIKFILTKEDNSKMNFLKKKINLKTGTKMNNLDLQKRYFYTGMNGKKSKTIFFPGI